MKLRNVTVRQLVGKMVRRGNLCVLLRAQSDVTEEMVCRLRRSAEAIFAGGYNANFEPATAAQTVGLVIPQGLELCTNNRIE